MSTEMKKRDATDRRDISHLCNWEDDGSFYFRTGEHEQGCGLRRV
jgi:hypothetical protein